MEKAILTISTPKRFVPDIKCNGRLLRLKKVAKNTYAAKLDTKEDEPQQIQVFKYYPLSDSLWFVYGLLNFLIGFFGIFSAGWEKRCISLDVSFTLNKPQERIDLSLLPLTEGGTALSLAGEQADAISAEGNVYTVNTLAQKRRKKVILFSWLTFLACLIGGVALALYFFIN